MRKKNCSFFRIHLWIATFAVMSGIALFTDLFILPAATAEDKEIIAYPTLYSDTHITENAKTTDPRFKKLAEFNRNEFLASAAVSLRTGMAAPEPSGPERGTWLWTPIPEITPEYRDSIIAGAKQNGIRTIYLSIDSYLDIYVLPDGKEKDRKKKAFDTILEEFVVAAHRNGIAVDAEAGWRNWAEPGNEYKPFAIIEYAREFNATHDEKLRGLQYDIEPYLVDAYSIRKEAVLRNFVTLVNETITRLDGSDLLFSAVIPDFFDGSSGITPRFFYSWRYTFAYDHLLRILDRRPGSILTIMAYRNFSDGDDGAIAISKDEIETANNHGTKIVIAQETGEVEPPYFTFYNTSRERLDAQIQTIQKTFSSDTSYNGIAIHYVNSLMALK